jgi:hypothetical protein
VAARFFVGLYRCSIGTAATSLFFALSMLLLSGIPVYGNASAGAMYYMLFAAPALLYAVGYSRGPKLNYFLLCIAGGTAVSVLGLEILWGMVAFDSTGDSSVATAWLRFGIWAVAFACLLPVMVGVWRRSEQDEREGGWEVPLIQCLVWSPVVAFWYLSIAPLWVGGIVGYWIEHRSVPGQRFAAVVVAAVVTLAAVAVAFTAGPDGYGPLYIAAFFALFLAPLSLLVPLAAWAMPRWKARFGAAGGA